MATVPDIPSAIKNIQEIFRGATFDQMTIAQHMKRFNMLEEKMGIPNVLIRAISLPGGRTAMIPGCTIFHWAYLEHEDDDTVEVLHFRPDTPRSDLYHKIMVTRGLDDTRTTYRKYRDVQDNANEGYRASKNFFVPPPDRPIDSFYVPVVQRMITNVRKQFNTDHTLIGSIRCDCKKYIKARLEKLLNQFHYTGNHYYLARADF